MNWQPFEEGSTIGKIGNEGGEIIIDQEHIGGARLTLEQSCLRARYAITCGIYGWMVHSSLSYVHLCTWVGLFCDGGLTG
jgi:hypothetical protein